MSLLSIVGHFKGLFKDTVIIDDGIFRLHYKVGSLLLFFVSILCSGIISLGNPIHCTLAYKDWDYMIPQPMFNVFCFIHSTFIIPNGAGVVNVEDQLYPYPGVGHLGHSSGMIIIKCSRKTYCRKQRKVQRKYKYL